MNGSPSLSRLNGLLSQLESALNDTAREWVVLQLTLERLAPNVRDAVWAAAVPHWFNTPFLVALQDIAVTEADDLYKTLQTLSIVEVYSERGHALHGRTRTLLLNHLWNSDRDRYCALSYRAAVYCARQDQTDALWCIETLYHRLLSGEDDAPSAYIAQIENWHNSYAYDYLALLAQALLEPARAGWLPAQAQAQTYESLGDVYLGLSEYAAARARYEEALPIYREINNRLGEANVLCSLGDVHLNLSEYAAARARYEEALLIYREIGTRQGKANVLCGLGDVHLNLSEYAAARACYEEALPIYREIDNRYGEAAALCSLGDVHLGLSEYTAAQGYYEEALPIYREINHRKGVAGVLCGLGDVYLGLSEYAAARARYEEALPIYREINNRLGEANALYSLGDVHLNLSEYAAARARYEEALLIYHEIGTRQGEANVLCRLGEVHLGLSEYAAARACYEEALPIYREIDNRLGEASTLLSLGNVYAGQDDGMALIFYDEAVVAYGDLGLVDEQVYILNRMASCYERRKDYESALAMYTWGIELAPQDAMWYRNRAWFFCHFQKDGARARADLERAADLQPEHPYLILSRGDLAILEQDYERAIAEYQSFISAWPDDPNGYFGLGLGYLATGRVKQALSTYRQALFLTVDQNDVQNQLSILHEFLDQHERVAGGEPVASLLEQARAELATQRNNDV